MKKCHLLYFTVYLGSGLLFTSCDTPVPYTPSYPNAIPCPDDFKGGILIGGCIEGLKPYDSVTKMFKLLGKIEGQEEFPDYVLYGYNEERGSIRLGVVKSKQVIYSVSINEWYKGTISNGIKFGMSREEVRAKLGQSNYSIEGDDRQSEVYVYKYRHETYSGSLFFPDEEPYLSFGFNFRENQLDFMNIFPGKPIEAHPN